MPHEETPTYDVALSFAAQDRSRARSLAEALRRRGVNVFSDEERVVTWGADLPDLLFDLYHRRARFCVMLVSTAYTESQWTALERKAVQARALNKSGYALPVQLDGSQLPGPLSTVGFVSWPPEDEHTIAEMVVQKLGGQREARAAMAPATVIAPLKIDDVIVVHDRHHMTLDVRLRNAGSGVVNVTRADVHVLGREELMSAYHASAKYQVMLHGEHNVVPVAHVLQPGEVDAFLIEVGYTSNCSGAAEVILRYNGDQEVTSAPFSFRSWR